MKNVIFLTAWLAVSLLTFTLFAGPARAAAPQWQPAGWGGGGLFWAAAFHPTKPNVIYMGGDVGGVYRSDDGGAHWRLINNGLRNYAIYSLAVGPAAPDTIYAGTTGGLERSTDGGTHWTFLPETAKAKLHITAERGKNIRAVALDPKDPHVVYAGTPLGIVYKSTDSGAHWTKVYAAPKGWISSVVVDPHNTQHIYAATSAAGLVRSADGGQTWTDLKTPSTASSIAISPQDPNVLLAGFGEAGIYRSADAGATWTAVNHGIWNKTNILEVVISPRDPDHYFAIGTIQGWSGHFFYSTDAGASWHESSQLKVDPAADPTLPGDADAQGMIHLSKPTNLALDPNNPDRLFISANWRPCISSDGGKTWTESARGADISVVYDLQFSGPRTYAAAMDEGVLVTSDGGKAWSQLWPRKYSKAISGHDWRLAVWQQAGVDCILSTSSPWDVPINQVIFSRDGGQTFTASHEGFPDKRPTAETLWGQGYIRGLTQDPSNPLVLYAGIDGSASPDHEPGGVFKTTDGGATWHRLAHQPASLLSFFSLAIDPTNPRRLFWASCGNDGGLYRSDDGGESWTRVFSQEKWLFNVMVTPQGTVYAPGKDLWRSDDHGKTWRQLTHFKDWQIVGLAVKPSDENTLWLSRVTWNETADGGIYQSTDGGATWTDISGDIPYRKPLVLRYNANSNELWAAGVGIYKLPLPASAAP